MMGLFHDRWRLLVELLSSSRFLPALLRFGCKAARNQQRVDSFINIVQRNTLPGPALVQPGS